MSPQVVDAYVPNRKEMVEELKNLQQNIVEWITDRWVNIYVEDENQYLWINSNGTSTAITINTSSKIFVNTIS